MEGVPPSSMDDAVNQLEFETFNISELSWSPPEEVPVNQSSILCNDQAGQNRLVDNNDSIQQATQFPQTMMEVAPPSSVEDDVNFALNQLELETLLSGPPWSPQFPPHNLQLSGDHNQGQADQASVIPHIDNMQQESLVSQNFGRSTRSQMENLQVHVLQNQNARPNASDAGPDSSLQSQNRGLNTQQDKMVRPNDSFWKHVEDMNDGKKTCTFCGHLFANGTSISRIKWHLSGETRHGVVICGQVPKEVQEAAFLAIYGSHKRHKSIPSSSNVNDSGISTCPQDNEVHGNLPGDAGRMQEQVGTLGVDAHESRGEAAQGTNVMAQLPGCTWHQIYSEAQKLNAINLMLEEEDEEPGAGARSCRILKDNTSETRGVLFPTSSNKPVGQAFKEIRKMIWSLLKNDEVSTIGIYGMGGAGKTTILQHIHNKLLRRPDICDHVWWVTVSQDFSINRLQNLIAKRLHLDLSSEDDDKHRAAKLSEELRKKQKWIIILDDLWDNFELHDVGIHSLLILTTRSQTVCDQIDCQHKIEVKPLFEGDSWTLFKENLGRHITLSDKVEEIAKAVARECAGLPLGIITVSRSLRGVKNLNEWRNTLKELGESGYRDMNEKVFKVLRVSYDRLDDALKHCLLYCALFPEDHMIERGELIGYLINEGIIKGMRRRQEAFDKGHTMLNRLEYFSLLESAGNEDDGSKCVMMHDLIRDMAIQILQENSQVIVKAGAQLEELPDAEEWTENLTRVSLMENKIIKIPSSHSPMCPNLSTLLLCRNYRLESIPDSFFEHLHGLKILDLSRTGIEKLPESVSDLVSLTELLLIDCEWLGYVPSLEKLRALKTLDLYGTSLVKMPQGMECLSYLRYFRIDGCGEEEFPSGILPKLSHLQVLALGERCTVEGMEVGCLGKLETLECHFKGFSDFVEYLTSQDEIHSLSTYKILVGTVNEDIWIGNDDLPSKAVMLGNCNINPDRDFEVKFLNDIQGLFCDSMDARSLCDVLSLESATELEIIYICRCYSMESLVSSSWFGSATPPLPSHNGMFSRLKEFYCFGCNNMEKLFPLELLSYLVNLEVINVSFCEKMEEIIGTTDEESSTSNPIVELTLPKLTILRLIHLPKLKGICSAKLICNSLRVIEVRNCKKLKRMAISLPLLENGQPSPHPSLEEIAIRDCEKLKRIAISLPFLKNGQPSPHPSLERIDVFPEEWWETVVEWEAPNAKEVLRPIVYFRGEDTAMPIQKYC